MQLGLGSGSAWTTDKQAMRPPGDCGVSGRGCEATNLGQLRVAVEFLVCASEFKSKTRSVLPGRDR
jgi:hypothetical protein